jgi:predicted TIM-barrel fold metal-dependent hydrolase
MPAPRAPVIDIHIHPPIGRQRPAGYDAYMRHRFPEGADWVEERYGTPEAILANMDASGVDYSLLLAQTVPITSEVVTNERLAAFCRGWPRLLPCATVNPYLEHDPAGVLERLVTEQGFRALKLYPTYAYYYPNDRLLYPIYAVAERLQVPVLVHTGSSVFPGSRLKYGDPIYLDDVAVDFPDLAILQCHGGRPIWYSHAEALVRFHRNVYIDVTGLPPHKLPEYFPVLPRIAHKLVFGSDWPGPPGTVRGNVDAIRALGLPEDVTALILGGTAARLLKLEALTS